MQLTGDTVHPDLDHMIVEVEIAGQLYRQSIVAEPPLTLQNRVFEYVWDGLDGFGRPLQGQQKARVRVGNVWPNDGVEYV